MTADRQGHPYFLLLDPDFRIKLASGTGQNPIARFYESGSPVDQLPEAVSAVVRDLLIRLDHRPCATAERLTIEVLRLDGSSGPHIGVLISETDQPLPRPG